MKSKDSKIQISLKILVKIIEDKIQAKNVTVLSAGIFNPYLKKGYFKSTANSLKITFLLNYDLLQ
jgi:hypothetical protein